MKTSFTCELTEAQVECLRQILTSGGYEAREIPYTQFAYAQKDLVVSVYIKKNKLLIQGKGTEEFIEFVLEPKVTGVLAPPISDVDVEPHFGIDESGKGDYLGPLVIAGVFVNSEIADHLLKLGVCDSKLVSSSAKIKKLADGIRKTPGIVYHIVSVGPERYNQLYAQFKNLNRFLAWGHATVIETLATKVPDCPMALSDQFANPIVLKSALAKKNVHIRLEQRTKAESDVAVAAASILARERFVNWMDAAGKAAGIEFSLGVSPKVVSAARQIVETHGESMLAKVAKLHFKTTKEVLGL